ncbi:MAG: hypothetical protein IJL70_07375, partial [Treponema sp.]|nr:hypothetical protein [Treponema sp.]
LTASPSMLTNLGSTTAANVLAATPRPGVTGTLPVANGGTGLTASPSMLTNLGSTTAANVLAATPRPGVTGTLPVANGGTGATATSGARQKLGIGYGTCGTAAATAAKTATISGFTLETGSRVAIKFTYANTAASPTLNINSTGAKVIYLRGTTKRPAGGNYYTWNAGETVEFVYTGSAFEMQKAINMTLSGTTLYVEY